MDKLLKNFKSVGELLTYAIKHNIPDAEIKSRIRKNGEIVLELEVAAKNLIDREFGSISRVANPVIRRTIAEEEGTIKSVIKDK
jgi:hypothetical protein